MLSFIFKKIFLAKQLSIFNRLKRQSHDGTFQKEKYQINKLKSILSLAKDIPYHKESLKKLDIENLTYDSFSKLPLLSKHDIRLHIDSLLNKKFRNMTSVFSNTSGGSTGEPVKFYQTRKQADHGRASYHFANYLNGASPFDSMLIFWGALRDMNRPGEISLLNRMRHLLYNSKFKNTFVLNEKTISEYVGNINRFKPKIIKAYVHSLYSISKYINKHKLEISCMPIIHTTTGPLYPEMRDEIAKAFNGAHVFSFYGSREVSAIATEVPNGDGMFVMYDNVFIEIIGNDGKPVKQGEEGEIVVTTLNNEYMPLIRYRIGDRGIKGDSSTTFGTLKLLSVLGRSLGVIYKTDGSYIDGQFFTTLFFNVDGINNFQLVQKSIDRLILKIVKNDSFNLSELNSIKEKIMLELGSVTIEVIYTERIDLTKTGKIMYVYSEIDL